MIFISKCFRSIVFVFIVFFHNVSADESSGLAQVSPAYLGVEMIQPGKQSDFKKMISQVELFLCPDKLGLPEEGQKTQRPKREKKINKDENTTPKTLTDKNRTNVSTHNNCYCFYT